MEDGSFHDRLHAEQLFCPSLEAVEELSGADALVSFEHSEQQRSPYGVVWANTELFTPVADA